MSIDAFQLPAFVTIILALSSMVVIPVTAMALSKTPVAVSEKISDAPDGAACSLPPTVELEGKNAEPSNGQLPPMDIRAAGNIKTATFAMG